MIDGRIVAVRLAWQKFELTIWMLLALSHRLATPNYHPDVATQRSILIIRDKSTSRLGLWMWFSGEKRRPKMSTRMGDGRPKLPSCTVVGDEDDGDVVGGDGMTCCM